MPLASLSASYSTPDSRSKQRRAAVRAISAVVGVATSARFPAEPRSISGSARASSTAVNNVAYIYKPMADLLGIIASSDAGAFGGEVEPQSAPGFLGDLSWLFASDPAVSTASAGLGDDGDPLSILAVNAAYESSMDSDDQEA